VKSDSMAMRCELCDNKEGMLANCASCSRRFHPICAAQKKLCCARSNRTEWNFYCEAHPPADAAFDANRQTWITQEILGQLQDLRRSLERGRMLLEMTRQRDRQHKRVLNTCKLPLMEASMEIVLKKRPSAFMKELYHDLTGETLRDVPHRAKAAPPSPRNPRKRVKSSPRAAAASRSSRSGKRAAPAALPTPERSSKRRRTRADSGASNDDEVSTRRSSRRKSLQFSRTSDDESVARGEGVDGEEEVEAQKKIWARLAVPEEVDHFDLVVAEEYPELVVRSSCE
jgi:hypothetical protein